jgi:hypothetical protein
MNTRKQQILAALLAEIFGVVIAGAYVTGFVSFTVALAINVGAFAFTCTMVWMAWEDT